MGQRLDGGSGCWAFWGMRAELDAIIEDLKRRRAEGEEWVYVSDGTLRELKEKAGGVRGQKPEAGIRDVAEKGEAGSLQSSTSRPEASVLSKACGFQIAPIPEPPELELPDGEKHTRWHWLRDLVLNCPVCREHARITEGKHVVFGVGNIDAEIFFCGEAPGAEEETEGEPFVGKAGQLLTKIIQAMGLQREDVYIGNILNWRPEKENMEVGNRPPTAEEMAYCLPYLKAQVAIVEPKVIVALGMTAVNGLLGPDPQRRMGKIRGQWLDFEGAALIPTYHPSYLLRYATPEKKRQVWEDMLQVMEKVGLPISEKQRGFFR